MKDLTHEGSHHKASSSTDITLEVKISMYELSLGAKVVCQQHHISEIEHGP